MNLRFRFTVRGGHVHCRVFGSLVRSSHMPKCGELVFRIEEWARLKPVLQAMGFECVDDEMDA